MMRRERIDADAFARRMVVVCVCPHPPKKNKARTKIARASGSIGEEVERYFMSMSFFTAVKSPAVSWYR